MPCPWHDFGLAGESLPVRAKSLWDSSNPWKTMKVEVILSQSCSTLCKPKDCSPPGSSVHGILQVRILEWVAIPFSKGDSQHRD